MKKNIIACLVLICSGLSACSVFHPFQPDIQQGNLYTSAMLAQVKLGMSKDQVVAILGSPVLENIFNNNHWAYVYSFQHRGRNIDKKRVDIYFQNGRVVRIV